MPGGERETKERERDRGGGGEREREREREKAKMPREFGTYATIDMNMTMYYVQVKYNIVLFCSSSQEKD